MGREVEEVCRWDIVAEKAYEHLVYKILAGKSIIANLKDWRVVSFREIFGKVEGRTLKGNQNSRDKNLGTAQINQQTQHGYLRLEDWETIKREDHS